MMGINFLIGNIFDMKILRGVLVAFFVMSVSCTPSGSKPVGSAYAISVTDFRGKEIHLAKPATRIVCLIESALSGLYMLNAESRVVGVPSSVYNESTATQYAILDDRIKNKNLPSPGNWDFVSLENLVALKPDLVIIWSSQQESIEAIEEKGIPVYGVFLKSFSDVYKEIDDLGKLTGTTQRADSIINYTKNEISIIQSQLKERHHEQSEAISKSVYFIWSQGLLETSGATSTVNELIELAGAKNACRQPQEHIVVNMENLLQWNPDVMLMWYNDSKNANDYLTMPELRYINAIKNKQVYELPSVFWCDLWTLKYQYAVKLLAKNCYPETFENLNLDLEKQKMMKALYKNNLLINNLLIK